MEPLYITSIKVSSSHKFQTSTLINRNKQISPATVSSIMAIFTYFLKYPLECCLRRKTTSKLQYDDVKHKTPSSSFPTEAPESKSNDIEAEVEEIIDLRSVEREKRRPIVIQIDSRSRALCIDSLINAAEKLHCAPRALHVAVNYFDRYISSRANYLDLDHPRKEAEVEDLRFVGLTCLMIASRYHDGPEDNFSFVAFLALCRNGTTADDMLRMERRIMSYIGYEVGPITAWSFLERLVRVSQGERETPLESLECMAGYYADAALLSGAMVGFLPSLVAAASVFLARYVLESSEKPWSGALRDCTMYGASELRECVVALHECCYGSSYGLGAVTVKYSKKKYNCVALKGSPPSLPLLLFQD